jgi:cell wall-associated NlpC family hydrolase
MLKYDHLVGREFKWGSDDCYGLLRDFYRDNFSVDLPNIARPENFWENGMNLYMDNYYQCGFRAIDVHPTQWQVGDVFLMAILSNTPNHVAMLVEDGRILHHLYGNLSTVEFYSGKWRDRTVGVFRHKDVKIEQAQSTQDFMSLLPEQVRKKIDALREAHGISEG